jgi:hypothetical protein
MSLSKAQIKPYKRLTLANPMPSTTDAANAPYEVLKCEIEAPTQEALTDLTQYGPGLINLAQRLGLTLDPEQTTAEARQRLVDAAEFNARQAIQPNRANASTRQEPTTKPPKSAKRRKQANKPASRSTSSAKRVYT